MLLALSSDDDGLDDGVHAIGGFGNDSGVGGSKHLLPAKHGDELPLTGVRRCCGVNAGDDDLGFLVCGRGGECRIGCCFLLAGVTMTEFRHI